MDTDAYSKLTYIPVPYLICYQIKILMVFAILQYIPEVVVRHHNATFLSRDLHNEDIVVSVPTTLISSPTRTVD